MGEGGGGIGGVGQRVDKVSEGKRKEEGEWGKEKEERKKIHHTPEGPLSSDEAILRLVFPFFFKVDICKLRFFFFFCWVLCMFMVCMLWLCV